MGKRNNTFDKQVARQWCMVYGTQVGAVTSASFLCMMYGLQSPLLGQVSNLLALFAFFVAIGKLRTFSRTLSPLTFGQACWMAIQIYFFAILLTAVVQFVYFQFLDGGRMAEQMRQMFENKEYRNMVEQMATDIDTDTMIAQTLATLSHPVSATMQLMWMNCLAGLLLTIPTAWLGNRSRAFRAEDNNTEA